MRVKRVHSDPLLHNEHRRHHRQRAWRWFCRQAGHIRPHPSHHITYAHANDTTRKYRHTFTCTQTFTSIHIHIHTHIHTHMGQHTARCAKEKKWCEQPNENASVVWYVLGGTGDFRSLIVTKLKPEDIAHRLRLVGRHHAEKISLAEKFVCNATTTTTTTHTPAHTHQHTHTSTHTPIHTHTNMSEKVHVCTYKT